MKRLTLRAPRRMRHGATILLLTLAALLLAPATARAETYWVDGYELEVTLRPGRGSFVLGEPVTLELIFENRTDIDLEMLLSGEQEGAGWPDDFEITVVGPDGERLPRYDNGQTGRQNSYTNSFVRAVRHGPHAVLRMIIILSLESWVKLEKPGVYTVTLRRGLRVGPYGRRYRLFPGTTKPAVELRLKTEFTVTEGGAERTGKLIEELRAQILACDQTTSVEATSRLIGLKDERALKYMVEAMQKCRNASIRYQVLGAISKFETDEALEALKLAVSDKDEDFRTVAAQALAQNKHPKARTLLLSLRTDPYYGVRLMVLNALEMWDTERARRLIWEMTNDEHPMVKSEALRFLQERAGHPPRR